MFTVHGTGATSNGGTRSAVFTVSLSNPTDQTVSVSFATADSTARVGNNDYQATSGTLTIPAKTLSATATVLVNGDLIREPNEIFRVNLGNPTNATIADGLGLGTIQNDDGSPRIFINDVMVTEGNSGTTSAVFTVRLSNPTDQVVTVDFATADGTAQVASGDYGATSGTLTIPPKTLTTTTTVLVNGDLIQESDETFEINLGNPTNAIIIDFQGLGTILNDDGQPSLTIDDVTLAEGNVGTRNAVFTVSLSNLTDQAVTVDFVTADSTARLANNDYQAASGTLTIPAKAASGTITVAVNGDRVQESDEVFLVHLMNPDGASIADFKGLGTIQNDDGMPSLSINDVSVTEGNGGITNAVFTVGLSNLTDQPVTVSFATADGTARLANNDYQTISGTLTIPPKVASGTVTVPVSGDAIRESNEFFLVNLSDPGNASIADAIGVGTILNDDGLPSLSIDDVTVTEGNTGTTSAIFTVSLSNPTDQAVTVDFAAADSTARLVNGDYETTSGTLTIPPKAPSGTIAVRVNGDLIRESNEIFRVNLSSPDNATIADFQGLGTIQNDDGLPSLSINDVTVTEGNSGTKSVVFTVTLSNPTDQAVSVSFATADSTARVGNNDYQATSGTLTIPAKTWSRTITVLVSGDLTQESNEVFIVNLNNPTNAVIADGQGAGTIQNDDGLPSVAIDDVAIAEGQSGTANAVFTVSLSHPTDHAVTVEFSTADATATLGDGD